MNNKIPPPIWGIATLIVMKLLSLSPWAMLMPLGQWRFVGIALFAIGLLIDFASLAAFRAHQTTVNPLKPEAASNLVQTSMFKYSRNPMYLGMACMLVGWGVWLGSLLAFIMVPVFIWIITTWQIKPEEAALQALFGDAYAEYCQRVRRWL